jgi:hypothetical protein
MRSKSFIIMNVHTALKTWNTKKLYHWWYNVKTCVSLLNHSYVYAVYCLHSGKKRLRMYRKKIPKWWTGASVIYYCRYGSCHDGTNCFSTEASVTSRFKGNLKLLKKIVSKFITNLFIGYSKYSYLKHVANYCIYQWESNMVYAWLGLSATNEHDTRAMQFRCNVCTIHRTIPMQFHVNEQSFRSSCFWIIRMYITIVLYT